MSEHKGHKEKGTHHKLDEKTKLEVEDVDWPHKHSKARTRKKKRQHEHHREGGRKHANW